MKNRLESYMVHGAHVFADLYENLHHCRIIIYYRFVKRIVAILCI
jgi:hypothetical protein